MTLEVNTERQWPLTAWVTVDYDDFEDLIPGVDPGTGVNAIEVPNDAVVLSGGIAVDTNFDDAAAETYAADVGDAVDTDRYTPSALSVDADAGTFLAITPTGYRYTAATWIKLAIVQSAGAAEMTQGSLRLFITYVVQGRGNENQG